MAITTARAPAFADLAADPRVWRVLDSTGDIIDCVEFGLLGGVPEADVWRAVEGRAAIERFPHLRPVLVATAAGMQGDHDTVLDALGDGKVDELGQHVPAYRRASLRLALARALAAHSRLGAARDQARRARDDVAGWPGWRRDEVDALLRRLDAAAGPEPTEGDLTPREKEVAALLAEGLSNADLARRLYISPKTAAVHVSNILMKLGMASRAEVAAWAVRSRLERDDVTATR